MGSQSTFIDSSISFRPAVLAQTNGRDAVTRSDVEDIDTLFHDAKASARLLAEQADKYIS